MRAAAAKAPRRRSSRRVASRSSGVADKAAGPNRARAWAAATHTAGSESRSIVVSAAIASAAPCVLGAIAPRVCTRASRSRGFRRLERGDEAEDRLRRLLADRRGEVDVGRVPLQHRRERREGLLTFRERCGGQARRGSLAHDGLVVVDRSEKRLRASGSAANVSSPAAAAARTVGSASASVRTSASRALGTATPDTTERRGDYASGRRVRVLQRPDEDPDSSLGLGTGFGPCEGVGGGVPDRRARIAEQRQQVPEPAFVRHTRRGQGRVGRPALERVVGAEGVDQAGHQRLGVVPEERQRDRRRTPNRALTIAERADQGLARRAGPRDVRVEHEEPPQRIRGAARTPGSSSPSAAVNPATTWASPSPSAVPSSSAAVRRAAVSPPRNAESRTS